MIMKRAALAFVLGAVLSMSAQASLLLHEGFENVAGLAGNGWILDNQSSPVGDPWFQGNTGVFNAQSGPDDSYIASNFLAAQSGGFIDNLLDTSSFSLASDAVLTFWARSDVVNGFVDNFAVWMGTTVGAGQEVVTQVLADTVAMGEWTKYTVNVAGLGAGASARFAFEYFGEADTSNYFAIDTVDVNSVVASVPEPTSTALFGIAILGLVLNRRRNSGVNS
jgi:hypothetical protein